MPKIEARCMQNDELTTTTTKPDRLIAVRYRQVLQVTFADGRKFFLPVNRLQMPVNEINWPTATCSSDGTALIVCDQQSVEIPIIAGAIRCMVDKDYNAQAKAIIDALMPTREERRALAENSELPAEWDSKLSQDANVRSKR